MLYMTTSSCRADNLWPYSRVCCFMCLCLLEGYVLWRYALKAVATPLRCLTRVIVVVYGADP